MAPMPPLSGLSAGDSHHRGGSAPASPAADGPVPASSGSSLLLRGVLASSAAGRYFAWKPHNAPPPDETDGSGEQGEEEEIHRKTQRSISECYFAVKGTALVLPHDESMHVYRCSNNNVVAGDIRAHLQSMLYMLRREDTLKMAVKLESAHPTGRTRYLVVVSRTNAVGAEEACLLGIDCNHSTTIGLVIPVWADARITLDGDGGFSVTSSHGHYIFKPVSVQAMWSALQSLHKACAKAREFNYFQGGGTHQWVQYYAERIQSDQSCLNEWHAMDDLVSKRPPTPDFDRSRPTQKDETEALIRSKLKELMMSVDLDEVTSKFMRSRLEEELDMSLQQFKSFIDQEMLTILGQMDAATEILEYLYLGSEWNASNLEELKDKGVGHILNVTREIDNFYPGLFDYFNIRVYDDETTEMLKHWDKTYKYIAQAKEQGSKVLVHCKMGISRSASVVIAYVMKAYGWDLRQALDFVKTRRSCIKPNSGFLKQLETYQGILHASKQRHNSIWRSKSETNLKDEQPDRSGGRRDYRATVSQALNMGSVTGVCGSMTDGSSPLRASNNSSSGSSLLVPGSVSRPKSWSPDDLASDAFFAANNSNNNSDGMPSPMHSIALGRPKPSRRRTGRPRYGTDPLCYTIPPLNTMNTASTTLQQVHAAEQEKNAKNAAANGVKANLTAAAPLAPPKCPPAVATIADEDPGLRRVASVKDRICELESQAGAPKPGGAKPVAKTEVIRSSTTDAVPAAMRLSKPPLAFLGGPAKTGAAEESPVNVYSCLPTCGGGESSSLELLRDVQPVASQTKPLTPKHTAVIVKSSPPAWTLGGGDSDREPEPPMAAEAVPPTTPKDATFSYVLRRSIEDRVPTSPGGVTLQRSATDVALMVAPTSQAACRPAGRHHTLPPHCDADGTGITCTARPLAEICKLQVGFGEDSKSQSSIATSETRRDAATVVSPLVAELQVDGKKSERLEEHAGVPADRAGSLLTRCKLRKTKPSLEEKSFARALCLEGGAFPSQTRSTPSTPPEQLPDASSSPSRQILRSQSLRCEHRPRSLALPAATVPPCMSGRSPPKIPGSRVSEAQPLPAFAPGPEIRHSMSTPSVMEAVNEVLCETRQVISNAMHFIPCPKTPPETYSPTRGSCQGVEHVEPDITLALELSEVPQVGIVRQQRAVLEGLQPLRGGTTPVAPVAASADRKPPVGDSTGRSKKEQARLIKELGSTMLPSAPATGGDSPPLSTADQQPVDDESAVGVVKRLTKELEAKARNGKTKPSGITERLVIVERSTVDGGHEPPNNGNGGGASASTPNSPVCERHCCGPPFRGGRAFSEGRPGPEPPPVPAAAPAPPTPSRCASLDADRLRRLSATRSITALLARAPRAGELPPSQLPSSLVTGTPTVALIATMPAPAPVGANATTLPGGLQRKVRKQQGKTHPLSKLTVRQRHANPLYNTM
ncbi:protein phosphatase Slingshot isoform X3 [Amblyomma americanum]